MMNLDDDDDLVVYLTLIPNNVITLINVSPGLLDDVTAIGAEMK